MAVVLNALGVATASSLHDGEAATSNIMVAGAALTGVPSTVTATIWCESEGGPMGEYYWPTAMTLAMESGGQFTGLTGEFNRDGALWVPTGDGVTTTIVETETGTWQGITITQSAGAFFGNIPPVDQPFDINIFFDAAYGWDEEYAGAIDFSGTFGVSVVASNAAPTGGLLSAADLASMRGIQALALPDSIELLELSSNQNALGEEEAPASYTVINTVPGRLAVDSVTHPFDAGRTVQTDDYILTFANDVDLSGADAFRVFDDVFVPFGEVDNRARSWRTAQRIKVRLSDLQDDPSVA